MKLFSLFVCSLILFSFLPQKVQAAIELSISNFQSNEDHYAVDVKVSGLASDSSCYVQALFTSPSVNRYFGKTWSPKGEWFVYQSSPIKDYIRQYFPKLENDQSQTILINSDPDDSDYNGAGEYLLKFRRYTGESTSHAGESNILPVVLMTPTPLIPPSPSASSPTPTSQVTVTPTQTPSPTKTPTQNTITATPIVKVTAVKSPSQTEFINLSPSTQSGEVLSHATFSSPIEEPLSSQSSSYKAKPSLTRYLFLIGLGMSMISGSILYFRHQKG